MKQIDDTYAEDLKERIEEEVRNKYNWRQYRKEKRQRSHHAGNMVWGLIVIFSGATFLLNSLGIIPWEVWHIILSYWPVLLVLVGLYMIIGDGPGADIAIFLIAFFLFLTVWTKALTDINSPLVHLWGLDHLPWIGFLRTFQLQY